jgi:hypothetical protein
MQIEFKELRDLIAALLPVAQAPCRAETFWQPGKKYFIRTVTHHHTGVLREANAQAIILEKAAWISDDGRFQDSLANGQFAEVEMFPDAPVYIGLGSIIDAVEVKDIPTSQK